MPKKIHTTDRAPAAVGPYSQAVSTGNMLFCSGQLPIDPATGQLVSGDIATRTHRIMANIEMIAEAAGTSLANTVKTTIFLTDLDEFKTMNEAYASHFPADQPARSTVQVVRLPLGANIEIEAVIAL